MKIRRITTELVEQDAIQIQRVVYEVDLKNSHGGSNVGCHDVVLELHESELVSMARELTAIAESRGMCAKAEAYKAYEKASRELLLQYREFSRRLDDDVVSTCAAKDAALAAYQEKYRADEDALKAELNIKMQEIEAAHG